MFEGVTVLPRYSVAQMLASFMSRSSLVWSIFSEDSIKQTHFQFKLQPVVLSRESFAIIGMVEDAVGDAGGAEVEDEDAFVVKVGVVNSLNNS